MLIKTDIIQNLSFLLTLRQYGRVYSFIYFFLFLQTNQAKKGGFQKSLIIYMHTYQKIVLTLAEEYLEPFMVTHCDTSGKDRKLCNCFCGNI